MKYSILDFSTKETTISSRKSLNDRIKLAKLAESLNYNRFWISENDSNPVIVGSTPELIMSHLALATENIRIGSAGIMIPYYNGEKIADTFKTMAIVRNSRIDVGVGQVAGDHQWFSKALNENAADFAQFAKEMNELKRLLNSSVTNNENSAYASLMQAGSPEIFILNSHQRAVSLTADIGAGFLAAHYLNPSNELKDGIKQYREQFAENGLIEKATVILGVFISIGESPTENAQLEKDFTHWSHLNRESATHDDFQESIIGSAEQVVEKVSQMAEEYLADEVMLIPNIDNKARREKTIQLFSEALSKKRKAYF
ncbi:MsnO8 family LLM class oxidoreductase [Desemzia sp. RIT804]|uniref:MsnO8 family LLM class oxidoreductase n=1 Tax=Desemzia sp. RIT 804 TaxID=2810209 RepID=UPI0019510E4B|nr:MsnO8 family LLM class oxidoreductase [Desemzia sp. RIT 804]MBM6614501.1 MsnO8 family LLM class oxidoreductase [Desemzia sp. RIT 804]